jgi:hypothetical protein
VTFLDLLPQTKAEAATDVVAIGAMTSPLWLHEMSSLATDLLPIAGVLWLAVQIGIKLHTTYWKNK